MIEYAVEAVSLPIEIRGGLLSQEQLGASPLFPENNNSDRTTHLARSPRILIVDDEEIIADTLVRILTLSGFAAQAVYSGDAALEAVDTHCPDIVLTDIRMPGRNGIETAIAIREHCPAIRVVLFSGQAGTTELIDQAGREGLGFELWSKPIHPRELVERLRRL